MFLKPELRKSAKPTCVCLASPSTPRSLLPKDGRCRCALGSHSYFSWDNGTAISPRDLRSALEELELEGPLKNYYQTRDKPSTRTLTRYTSETPPDELHSSRPLSHRLKIPSSCRRGTRSNRPAMMNSEHSPTSSTPSPRCGSPASRHSSSPFTYRGAQTDTPVSHQTQQYHTPMRTEPADSGEGVPPAGTEPPGREEREQGANNSKGQDSLAMQFKRPDSTLRHSPKKFSRPP